MPQNDHDLLIRIDQNLSNLITKFVEQQEIFKKHVVEDKENFFAHDIRLRTVEKLVWVCTGVVLTANFIIQFFIK